MKTAGVAQLKARLSRYLDAVKAGEELLITDRGLPVARIVPLEGDKGLEGKRRRLVRAGLLQPPRGRVPASFFQGPRGGSRTGRAVLAALIEERRESR
jgi:prevent-host-death family protein